MMKSVLYALTEQLCFQLLHRHDGHNTSPFSLGHNKSERTGGLSDEENPLLFVRMVFTLFHPYG